MKKWGLIHLIVLTALLLSACAPGGIETPVVVDAPVIDPLFQEIYNLLGGEDIIGPAISSVKDSNGLKIQYTERVLMLYDPQAAPANQFRLSPIGLELHVAEPPVAPQPGGMYLNGHNLFPEFVPLFETLGGVRFVGNPLTEMHYNPHRKRYEQYFENMGLYRLEGDALDQVHALAYGAWRCSSDCRSTPPFDALIEVQPSSGSPFRSSVDYLGQAFTGFALTEPYMAPDGMLEQVFENIVLAAYPENPEMAMLRPVPEKIGILNEPLVHPSPDPTLFFYEVEAGLGHNVPNYFLDYIRSHGNFEVFGAPTSELTPMGNVSRQCFVNLCLAHYSNARDGYAVRPEPFGYNYKQLFYHPGTEFTILPSPSPSLQVVVQVGEASSMVAPDQEQEINVVVLANNSPVPGVAPTLTVMNPDGTVTTFTLPETGSDGLTRLRVPAINAPNSTLIPYEVCITMQGGQSNCTKDSYLIWDNP